MEYLLLHERTLTRGKQDSPAFLRKQQIKNRKIPTDMKPFIISHMMTSVDGRIDCDMTEKIEASQVYYDALDTLACPSQMMGRVTLQLHYADGRPFHAHDKTPIGHEGYHMAEKAEGYTIALDTHGTLTYSGNTIDGNRCW